jgi:hypothetical protein
MKHFKELRKKALELVQQDLETVERDHTVMYVEHLEMVNAKFAELIVQECLMICKNYTVHSTQDKKFLAQNEVILKISDNIEEYFGIK